MATTSSSPSYRLRCAATGSPWPVDPTAFLGTGRESEQIVHLGSDPARDLRMHIVEVAHDHGRDPKWDGDGLIAAAMSIIFSTPSTNHDREFAPTANETNASTAAIDLLNVVNKQFCVPILMRKV